MFSTSRMHGPASFAAHPILECFTHPVFPHSFGVSTVFSKFLMLSVTPFGRRRNRTCPKTKTLAETSSHPKQVAFEGKLSEITDSTITNSYETETYTCCWSALSLQHLWEHQEVESRARYPREDNMGNDSEAWAEQLTSPHSEASELQQKLRSPRHPPMLLDLPSCSSPIVLDPSHLSAPTSLDPSTRSASILSDLLSRSMAISLNL